MRAFSVIVAGVLVGLGLSGCGPHTTTTAGGAAPSAVTPSGGAPSVGVPSGVDPVVPGSAGPVPAASPSPRALPGIAIGGPTPCLTSRQHFATEADRALPQVCLRVGGAFDLATVRPERSLVTQVASSDPTVLTCGSPRPSVCQARKAGQSIVTATDGGGQWRVAVFVGG